MRAFFEEDSVNWKIILPSFDVGDGRDEEPSEEGNTGQARTFV